MLALKSHTGIHGLGLLKPDKLLLLFTVGTGEPIAKMRTGFVKDQKPGQGKQQEQKKNYPHFQRMAK